MKKNESKKSDEAVYVKPSTKKHQPVDIVKGTGGSSSLYYTSLYHSLYYTSLYHSLYYYSLYHGYYYSYSYHYYYYYSLYTCWVAREVYGADNPKWLLFREWMLNRAPAWFRVLYLRHGERFARFISDKPLLKSVIRRWMDRRLRTEGSIWTNQWHGMADIKPLPLLD